MLSWRHCVVAVIIPHMAIAQSAGAVLAQIIYRCRPQSARTGPSRIPPIPGTHGPCLPIAIHPSLRRLRNPNFPFVAGLLLHSRSGHHNLFAVSTLRALPWRPNPLSVMLHF
jgi:hypothetical protein